MNTLVLFTCWTVQGTAERKQTTAGHTLGHYHDKTLRASVSILSSSFTPSRPPWIFSGLSRTSMLLVKGSYLTEKGRLIPATYVLVENVRENKCMKSSKWGSRWALCKYMFWSCPVWEFKTQIFHFALRNISLTDQTKFPLLYFIYSICIYRLYRSCLFQHHIKMHSHLMMFTVYSTACFCFYLNSCADIFWFNVATRMSYAILYTRFFLNSLKLLVLQGNIWCVWQIKPQYFALVRKTTLVTAVF